MTSLELELLLTSMDILNLCLEVDEFIFERAKGILKILDFGCFVMFISCSMRDSVIIIGIFLFNAVELYDHLLSTLVLDQNSSSFKHFFQLSLTR